MEWRVMTDANSRLAAIRNLLDDSTERYERTKWEAILNDINLTPETQSDVFKKQLYDLLITEMEEGYQRNDKLRSEKRRKTGRSSGFIPYQMRVNAPIGRFLFAFFKWHDFRTLSPNGGVKANGLMDIAEAFEFKIDRAENQRQFMTVEDRKKTITKEKNKSYNKRIWKTFLSAFVGTVIALFIFFMRRGGF